MKFFELFPLPGGTIDGDDRERLLELYRPPHAEWLRLNLIASVTGAAMGSDGTSATLSSAADRRILGVIRELSDIVLVGANTLRTEGYLLPRRSRLAIVTVSGDLGGNGISAAATTQTQAQTQTQAPLVLAPPAARDRVLSELPGAEFVALEPVDGVLSVVEVIAALRKRGYPSIVCEGGPSLAAQMLDAGIVDEFCLSTSPRVGGPHFPVAGTAPVTERAVTLTQLLVDEASGVYARWAL